jgi:hypothetical protein
MRAGENHAVGTDPAEAQRADATPAPPQSPQARRSSAPRRLWTVLAWIAGFLALSALFVRISLSKVVTSDGANNALQAWDMLHGHVLLHGWIIGDATYYTLELPVLAVSESLFGLHDLASYVASALTYGLVAVCAVAVAVTNSSGPARLARCGVVIAVLTAGLLVPPVGYDVWSPIEEPNHTGTAAFVLVSFLLVDRLRSKRYTAPLLCVVLCAGQLGDATVRYIAVPAVVLVCAYRLLAARRIRAADTVLAIAAIVSVPLETVVRAAIRHFGGYLMIAPQFQLASPRLWGHNAALTWYSFRQLFGILNGPNAPIGGATQVFGFLCLLAAAAGLVKVIVTWRTASPAEQMLSLAIVINVAAFEFTTMPRLDDPHEMAIVLPCGAVLAARALVPATISSLRRARAAMAAAGVAALLPLVGAASLAPATPRWTALISWLQAHHLRYGLSAYWDGSAVTEQSGGQVALRTVAVRGGTAETYDWETNMLWFDASRYDATFVVVQLDDPTLTLPEVRQAFGKPASLHTVANWDVLVYHRNLLRQVADTPPTRPTQ